VCANDVAAVRAADTSTGMVSGSSNREPSTSQVTWTGSENASVPPPPIHYYHEVESWKRSKVVKTTKVFGRKYPLQHKFVLEGMTFPAETVIRLYLLSATCVTRMEMLDLS
jgi:hypothetical protein